MKRTLSHFGITGRTALLASLSFAAFTATAHANPKLESYKNVAGAEKMTHQLIDVMIQAEREGLSVTKMDNFLTRSKTANGIRVEVYGQLTDEDFAAAAKAGLTPLERISRLNCAIFEVDSLTELEALSSISNVQVIRPVERPATSSNPGPGFPIRQQTSNPPPEGLVDGSGKIALNVPERLQVPNFGDFLLDGSGVAVGILSDSFRQITDNAGTSNEARRAEITLDSLEAGNYTIVVESSEPAPIELRIDSSIFLVPATDEISPEDRDCQGRSPISGANITVPDVVTVPVLDLPASTCSAGENFALFAFSVPTGETADINLQTIANQAGVNVSISVRTTCSNTATEIACAESEAFTVPTVTGLDGQNTGDLPAAVTILRPGPAGSSDEGAAMGELIHDIAPGAEMGFFTAFDGQALFAEGIRQLAGASPVGIDQDNDPVFFQEGTPKVVVDDVIYFFEPVYQVGIVQAAIEEITTTGGVDGPVPHFSAAGNFYNDAIREEYNDVSSGDEMDLPPSGGDLHKWSDTGDGYLPITIQPGGVVNAFLHWNQPSATVIAAAGGNTQTTGCFVDLDLYLLRDNSSDGIDEVYTSQGTSEFRISKNPQGNRAIPQGDALEFISYQNVTGETETLYLAVDHWDGYKDQIPQMNEPLEFTVIFQLGDAKIDSIDREKEEDGDAVIWAHLGSQNGFSVAAVNYRDTPNLSTEFGPTDEIDMEPFSSKGGQIINYFDFRGFPDKQSIQVPTLASVDGNNNTFFVEDAITGEELADFDLDGFPNFFGTSAAAPNAAAVAALMLQLNPSLTPTQIRAALVETAIDVKGFRASEGPDEHSGAGLIDATAALDFVIQNYGAQSGPPAPRFVDFNFSSAQGWQFDSPDGFTTPDASASDNGLNLVATDNENTFGYWFSEPFVASPTLQPIIPGADPDTNASIISGRPGPDTVFRVTWSVRTDSIDPEDTPPVRIRSNSKNFEHASEMMISSTGNAALSASAGDPRTYVHLFELPVTQSQFTLYFDLLGFFPSDADGANLRLEEVVIDALDVSSDLGGLTSEELYFFNGGDRNGWSSGSADDFKSVNTSTSDEGLVLGPVSNEDDITFGYWTNDDPDTYLERNRIYRATFQISSNVSLEDRMDVPPFRFRMNSEDNQMSSLVMYTSTIQSAPIPAGGENVTYRLWFAAPEQLAEPSGSENRGEGILLSFDYLYVPGIDDSPDVELTLEAVRLDSFNSPIQF